MRPTLYVAWYCPYAQRAWIALGLSRRNDSVSVVSAATLDATHHPRYQIKSTELVAATPPGTRPVVPTLVDPPHATLNDSIPIAARFLGASDAEVERAKQLDSELCGAVFYGCLKPEIHDARFAAWRASLVRIFGALPGPFLSGNQPGLADAVVFPFLWRGVTCALMHGYRGHELGDVAPTLAPWLNAMLSLPSVQTTLPADTDRVTHVSRLLYDVYPVYAEGVGLVGLVARSAHEPVDETLPQQLRDHYKRG